MTAEDRDPGSTSASVEVLKGFASVMAGLAVVVVAGAILVLGMLLISWSSFIQSGPAIGLVIVLAALAVLYGGVRLAMAGTRPL